MNIHTILFNVLSPGLKSLKLGHGWESENILRFLKTNLSNFLSNLIFAASWSEKKISRTTSTGKKKQKCLENFNKV